MTAIRVTLVALLALSGLAAGCGGSPEPGPAEPDAESAPPDWRLLDVGSTVSMRGLSVVSEDVVWLSGAEGRFFRTADRGETWQHGQVPGMADVDFRDVEGVDERTAYLLSAGATARIYKTGDAGRSWVRQYVTDAPGVFFDGMAFWDPEHGVAFSDPVDGRFLVIGTADGGSAWTELPADALPPPWPGEAGFAASGTNVAVHGDGVWIGTGGGAARVLHSADRGQTWTAQTTPMATGDGAGIFSLCFWDARHGAIVGGSFREPDATAGTAAWTDDGGLTWTRAAAPPRGYRSGVAVVPGTDGPTLVAVGPTGTDVSFDAGRTWSARSDAGFNAVAFAGPELGWAVGADGHAAIFEGPLARPD